MVRLVVVLLSSRGHVVRLLLPAALCLLAAGCIWIFHNVRVEEVGLHADSVAIHTPVKAHLRDGSTVLYRAGVLLARDTLRGTGVRFAVTLRDSTNVALVPLDSVVAMESFRRGTEGAASVIVSTLATGAAFVATVVSVVLIECARGEGLCANCPMVYADSAGIRALQAEGFSYTIGSTSEARDVDRLGIRADRDGRIVLQVRNEALETDYVNHVGLLEVRHAVNEAAYPDPNGAALAVRELVSATTITDDGGRDLRLLLARPEGAAFQTDEGTLAGVSLAHWNDAIYLTAPAPAGRDSIALVLRLRNSLLATLLYSEVMLGDRGAQSLDWIGRDLEGEGPALARWQEQRLGLRIAIWDGRRYRETARIRDSGPHAWKDVAAMIPVLQRDSVRVRLSFPADNWRIDQVVFAMRARRASVQSHDLSRLLDGEGRDDSSALATLRRADRQYLRMSPGERFSVEVQVAAGAEVARTFFFAIQGYYEPWIGRDGLRAGRGSGVAMSLDEQLVRAIQKWRTVREARMRAFADLTASVAESRAQ